MMQTPERITYEQLIAFAAGELDDTKAQRVNNWLKFHPADLATVAGYRTAMHRVAGDDSVAPPARVIDRAKAYFASQQFEPHPTWLDRASAIVARLIFDNRTQALAVRYGGEDKRIQLAFETDEVEIDVLAVPIVHQDDPNDRIHFRVQGQVTIAGDPEPGEVALIYTESGKVNTQCQLDSTAGFTMDAPSGKYDILIHTKGRIIALNEITLE